VPATSANLGPGFDTLGMAVDIVNTMRVEPAAQWELLVSGEGATQLPGGEIVPALQKGVIEAFEFNNPTSDKSFGAQDVSKIYMMGSFHQAAEFFEITFNKDKFNALSKDHQAVLKYAAEAASSANFWMAMDQYSKDLIWLKEKAGVKVYRTPTSVGKDQLVAWDKVLVDLDKDPFFKKVHASQRAFAHRVAYYELLNAADYKQAFDHYFPGELGF